MSRRALLRRSAGIVTLRLALAAAGGLAAATTGHAGTLAEALQQAACGDALVLPAGRYDEAVAIDHTCDAERPLVVTAERLGAVTLGGEIVVGGRHVTLRNLVFGGERARLVLGGSDNRVLGNRFTGWGHPAALLLTNGGRRAEVAYNEFFEPAPWRPDEYDDKSDYPLRIGIRSGHRKDNFFVDAWVHHNWFRDFPAKPSNPHKPGDYHDGQSDAIEVCASETDLFAGWRIERNLIEGHRQGHGILDVKCGGNRIEHNWLKQSRGRIDLRYGDNNIMRGNRIGSGGGARIRGAGHQITDNVFEPGAVLELMTGFQPASGRNRKPAARALRLEGNLGEVRVGVSEQQPSVPVTDVEIRCQRGSVRLDDQLATTVHAEACAAAQADLPAPPVRQDMVGPTALPDGY